MKYIFLNNVINVFNKRKEIISFILIGTIMYFLIMFFMLNMHIDIDTYDFAINPILNYKIDLYHDIKFHTVSLMLLILNFGLFILIAIDMFKDDLENADNLLERISINKWINIKIFIQFIFSFIVNLLLYLVVFILVKDINISYLIILKKVLVISILTCYIYLLLILIKKNIPLFIISLIPIISILFVTIDLRLINTIYLILVFIIMFILLNILCYYTKFSDIKE